MNTKNHQIRIVIYIIIGAVIAAVGVFLVLHSNNSQSGISLQDKLDLGHKYLVELSYDKAVLEFTDAIEIDPMNADAYLGLADAYIGQGDTDKAVEVLEKGFDKTGDDRIKEKLDELKPVEKTTVTTVTTVSETIAESVKNEYVYMYIPNKAKSDSSYCHYKMDYPTYQVLTEWSDGINQWGIHYELLDRESSSVLFNIFVPEKEDSIVNIDLSNGDVEIGKEFANSYRYEERVRDYKPKYVYDENGICREFIAYRKDNGEIAYQIKYDDHGNSIEGFWTDDAIIGDCNAHTTSNSYTYNDNGRIIKKMSTSTAEYDDYTEHRNDTFEYFYDSNQNMIKSIDTYKSESTDGSGFDGEFIDEYFYNSNNDLIKSIAYSKGEELNHTIYEYDENENLISMIRTSAKGNWEERTEYSYMRVKVLRSEVEKLKEDYGVELKVFEIE